MAMDLGKQVGPLPVGAWIVVVGAGLGVSYLAFRNKGGGEPTPPLVNPGTGLGGGGFEQIKPPSEPAGPKPPATNEEWAKRCIDWLIAQGHDAAVSDSALRKYLTNAKLSVQEYTLVKLALQHFGSPPVPLPPSEVPPPEIPPWKPWPLPGTGDRGGEDIFPPSPPVSIFSAPLPPTSVPGPFRPSAVSLAPAAAPSPISGRWAEVEPGTSLSTVAQRFYGSPNLSHRIYQANAYGVKRPDGSRGMIENPNFLQAGWRLFIPN